MEKLDTESDPVMNMKPNVLVLGATRDSAEKLKGKLFNLDFKSLSVGFVGAKKISKVDVHAVACYVNDVAEFQTLQPLMEEFKLFVVKLILAPATEEIRSYAEEKNWQLYSRT